MSAYTYCKPQADCLKVFIDHVRYYVCFFIIEFCHHDQSRSLVDNLVPLCKFQFIVIILYYFIDCFHSEERSDELNCAKHAFCANVQDVSQAALPGLLLFDK